MLKFLTKNTPMTFPFDTWYVTLAEAKSELMKEENYGYGLYKRKIKKFQPYNRKTFERHRDSYYFWLDLYVYKLLQWEGIHDPLWTMAPRWEQEIAYDWWSAYLKFMRNGAKADLNERRI